MSHTPFWKKALEEPNAVGWIVLLILVVAIGAGLLYLDADDDGAATASRPPPAGRVAR